MTDEQAKNWADICLDGNVPEEFQRDADECGGADFIGALLELAWRHD